MEKKILFGILLLAGIVQYACKKNNGGGPPVITSVRSLDTAKRDSFFVSAVPGAEIVIQGKNLGGLEQAFFNDTSAYFNPVYNTNSVIIITIPATAQTAATNPKVPSVIRLVTNHGTVTYSFTLYLNNPYINSISFDNTGTQVLISGGNFAGISKITFPGNDTALAYTVNKGFTQITATIPPGTGLTDSLRVFCTYGTAAFPFPPPMTISSLSNENGPAGTTLTINGTNFVGISQITFPGGITGTDIKSISSSQLTVTVPAGITAPDSLRLTGVLGSVTAPQLYDSWLTHSSPGYLSTFENQWSGNFDNTSFLGWTGTYVNVPTTTANYPGGTGACTALIQASPMGDTAGYATQSNAGFVQLDTVPWIANTSTPIAGYSMKFEVAVAKPWKAGAIWISVGGWYDWKTYTARYAPWESDPTGVFQPSGWVTVTIPLTDFHSFSANDNKVYKTTGASARLFSDYKTPACAFMIVNDEVGTVPANSMNIAIDNVRIVKGK